MKISFPIRAAAVFLSFLAACSSLKASDFEIEKQKLKLSLEYENLVDTLGNEIRTTGPKATYLFKAKANADQKLFCDFELQSGLKTYFDRHFQSGDLSPLTWSNRVTVNATVPLNKLYFGGGLYFRNKWLADSSNPRQFVDIFGGLGFREITGIFQAGYSLSPQWSISGTAQVSDLNFDRFPLSNSNWKGATGRLTRKFGSFNLHMDYQARSIDYDRPVFQKGGVIFNPVLGEGLIVLQHDRFQEAGGGIEYMGSIYFSGSYSYQDNRSNNPGFSYHNNRVSLLVGTELPHDFALQAYGIIQMQHFLTDSGTLPFPVLLDEAANNTMAISMVKPLSSRTELEVGLQRLYNNSSFEELNASKFILYSACNFRW